MTTNSALVLLWLVVGIVVLSLVLLIWWNARSAPQPGTLPPTCAQQVNPSSLIQLSGRPCCQGTAYRTSSELDMILAPFPTSYVDVCSSYCDQGSYDSQTQTCSSGNVEGFNDCIAALKPNQCRGLAMPIGVDGTTYYYGYEAFNTQTCKSLVPCQRGPSR